VLNIGEPMAVPIIRQLKKWIEPQPGRVEILDAPPGTSCPVVESMRGSQILSCWSQSPRLSACTIYVWLCRLRVN
jgi:MinD superfamily P-loop ATPase